MLYYDDIPLKRKVEIEIIKKGLANILISGLLMKISLFKDITCIKIKILKIIFRKGRNKLIKRAIDLLHYEVLDLKRVNYGKNHSNIINKIIQNYWISLALRI